MKKKTTKDRLVAFLYLLLKDEISAEKLEAVIEDLGDSSSGGFEMENGFLADYAEDMAKRLTENEQ
jgi:hypothetical protein